jgi:hypothetical protein
LINILVLFKTVTERFSFYQKAAAFAVGGALSGRAAVRFGAGQMKWDATVQMP